jgi:diphosphomevalonate decarboxylase
MAGGFVEWYAGEDHESSYAESIANIDHWDLVDLIAIVSDKHKAVGSTGGHALADTSPLQVARVADTPRRLDICREALLSRDFDALAEVVELDALMMHGVMMTSTPPVLYWKPPTLRVMEEVQMWRSEGFGVCFTMDAGANVHVISLSEEADAIEGRLRALEGIQDVLIAPPGGPASLLEEHLNLPDDA